MIPMLAAAAACLTDPSAILAANQRATILREQPPATVVTVYDVADSGLTGRETSVVDTGTGMFSEESAVGPILGGAGYDGLRAWARDLTGWYSSQAGGNKTELAVNQAYRNTGAWWRADRGGARIEGLGCDRIKVTPLRGSPFEASFDPTSHLLTSVIVGATFGNGIELRMSKYHVEDGVMVPTRIDAVTNGDTASAVTRDLVSRTVGPPRAAARYAMPTAQPDDWSIGAPGRTTVPFRLINNHVIIDVKVNGRGPFPFLLDTGGHEILTPATAAKLGLRAQGSGQSGGGGERTVTNGFTRVDRIDFGGAALVSPRVVVLDFSPLDVEGIELGGMLGVGFFERFVVGIDYRARTVAITDPRHFGRKRRASAGTPVPFEFYEHMPQVAGHYDGRPARLNIDTGSRSDVTLTSPFVQREQLNGANGGRIVTDGWGAGGPVRASVVRSRSIEFGPVGVCGALAGLSVAKRGTFADTNFEGNVGSGLLKRFRVTFDYRSRTMYMAALARPDPDTALADRSGMWLNLGRGGLQVMDVMAGGPAELAGLRSGDVLTMVAGEAVTDRSLSDWRVFFKLAMVGTPLEIRHLRGGVSTSVILRPVELVPGGAC